MKFVVDAQLPKRLVLQIFDCHIEAIVSALGESSLVELNQQGLVVHKS
jgi:predicted nuclease of predicted toxin-antitoxin system